MRLFNPSTIAERWKESYLDQHTGIWRYNGKEAIYNAIVAANGDAGKINAAIGNHTWTSFHCEECDQDQILGMEFDNWDGGIVVICLDCLNSAVQQASKVRQTALDTGS
jgi:hypothetical protein